jgi:hypothetical protein
MGVMWPAVKSSVLPQTEEYRGARRSFAALVGPVSKPA